MRFEDGFDPEWREILREPVSTAESTQLLERLAFQEYGDNVKSTLGDVCEATGATPQVVGRMLAEIRGKTGIELFGEKLSVLNKKLQSHDQRLTDQAEQLSMIGDHLGVKVKSKREVQIEQEIRSMAAASIVDRQNSYWWLLIAILIAIYVFAIIPIEKSKRSPNNIPPLSRTVGDTESVSPDR
ncbi:MAG: hypothetical protein ACKVQS_11800 [Fimbriimonadaceae bacterium]